MRIAVVSHPACLGHPAVPGHPERAERLNAAVTGAAVDGAFAVTAPVPARPEGVLALAHAESYLQRLRDTCRSGPALMDSPDNPVGRGSWEAIVAAACCAAHAAELAAEDRCEIAFAAVRPPGHHALRSRAMGYCYVNNAVITAETLIARGFSSVAVVDFDVHHGNGTQAHFYDRGDVFFLSVHQYPAFPGTGSALETGSGAGLGSTRNLPLALGADDETYCGALEAGLTEMMESFTPAAWVLSAGFDAHANDPVGECRVSTEGFERIGTAIGQLARGAPVVAVLEGGYDPKTLRESVHGFLTSLACALAP